MPPTLPPADDDASFEAADEARKAATRRALWILFGSIGLLFALFAYAFVADEEAPDTADLVVPRKNPPEAQNAYALLTKLVATLPKDPDEKTPDEIHYARIFDEKVAWDSAAVAAVLARYPSTLGDSVRAALEAPETEAPAINSYGDLMPEVGRFRSLAFTLTRQATLAWQTGDHAKAAELNLLALQLGSRVSQSGGALITVLTGVAIEGIAFASIQRHADSDTVPPAVLATYLHGLRPHELRIEDFHTAYKLEHALFANMVPELKKQGPSGLGASGQNKLLDVLMCLPGVWQPNRTIRWHAEFIRVHIERTDPLPAGAKDPAMAQIEALMEASWPGRAQNFTGRAFLAIAAPSLTSVTRTCHRGRANLRLTEIYLALRLHHLESGGELPESLAVLVPAHLPALPLDPFDGQPLRYDRAFATIWSTDYDRRTVTSAEGNLPRALPAYRLRFARPPEPLPTFAEYQASQGSDSGLFGHSERENSPTDVLPPE